MKNINAKKNSGGFPIWMAVAMIAMVAIVIATLSSKGLIKLPNQQPVLGDGTTVTVAYTKGAVSSGIDAKDAVEFKELAVADNLILPDDVITDATDLEGMVIKVDLYANTPLTRSLICPVDTDDKFNATTRAIDVSYVDLQHALMPGDFVDVRLKVSNTASNFSLSDEIVLAKKEVVAINGTTVTLQLNEDEQILLTAAAVDMSIVNADKRSEDKPSAALYTTTYVSKAQPAAAITYSNDEVVTLLRNNPNLINNPSAIYEKLTGMQ